MNGLYLVTDRTLIGSSSLQDIVLSAVQNGVSMVQLREKELNTRQFIDLAISLRLLLAPYNIPLLVNDRVDVALASRADGIHLGQGDMPVSVARQLMGERAVIGLSVETLSQVDDTAKMPVDYLGVSGIFPTETKTDLPGYWGLDGLKAVRARTDLPLVAIGGIDENNACFVINAGADMVAVVSAVCGAVDPGRAVRRLIRSIGESKHRSIS